MCSGSPPSLEPGQHSLIASESISESSNEEAAVRPRCFEAVEVLVQWLLLLHKHVDARKALV